MKLYILDVSNTSRPVRVLIAENNLPVEIVSLDFYKGEHAKPPYTDINPNALVPTLDDDGFMLTESSAIMKYLADKFDLPLYPKGLRERAQVNEMMDWFNTQFYRDYAYNVVYPQIYAHHKRPDDTTHAGTIEWGKGLTQRWLKVLDTHWLGKGNKFLVGKTMTIADIFGYALLTCGMVTRDEFKAYPNVDRWVKEIGKLPSWKDVNAALAGFADYVKDQKFVNV